MEFSVFLEDCVVIEHIIFSRRESCHGGGVAGDDDFIGTFDFRHAPDDFTREVVTVGDEHSGKVVAGETGPDGVIVSVHHIGASVGEVGQGFGSCGGALADVFELSEVVTEGDDDSLISGAAGEIGGSVEFGCDGDHLDVVSGALEHIEQPLGVTVADEVGVVASDGAGLIGDEGTFEVDSGDLAHEAVFLGGVPDDGDIALIERKIAGNESGQEDFGSAFEYGIGGLHEAVVIEFEGGKIHSDETVDLQVDVFAFHNRKPLYSAVFEQGSRCLIEEGVAVGVGAQDGSGAGVGQRTLDSTFDRLGFALVRNGVDDGFALEDLLDSHGDSLFGNVIEGREPALSELLFAAGFVESDDKISLFGLEVGGGIVEGDVAVLTDSDEGDVDGELGDAFAELFADFLGIGIASVDRSEGHRGDRKLIDETLSQVLTESGGVILGQTDVLVEVEEIDLAPVDVFLILEAAEHFKLAGSGGDDDVGSSLLGEGFADVLCSAGSGGGSEGVFVGINVDFIHF